MALLLHFDVHIPWAVTAGMWLRGVDVITAQEDASDELADVDLLDRATLQNRAMFTHDADFLVEANRRQTINQPFAGIIYVHQGKLTIGQIIADIELIAKVYDASDIANRVEYLPLRESTTRCSRVS